jgi:hypothetical protein
MAPWVAQGYHRRMSYHFIALILRTVGVVAAVGASMVAIWLSQKNRNA